MPSPLVLVVGVIFLLVAGIFAYRYFVPAAPATNKTSLVMPENKAVLGSITGFVIPPCRTQLSLKI